LAILVDPVFTISWAGQAGSAGKGVICSFWNFFFFFFWGCPAEFEEETLGCSGGATSS
jgi:hypothetical protein